MRCWVETEPHFEKAIPESGQIEVDINCELLLLLRSDQHQAFMWGFFRIFHPKRAGTVTSDSDQGSEPFGVDLEKFLPSVS